MERCGGGRAIRILVTGDRNWSDRRLIELVLRDMGVGCHVIIQGGASGADALAKDVAQQYSWLVEQEDAKWRYYGSAAGPIRNRKMLDDHDPDIVVAFHDDLRKSKGTKDMVTQAKKRSVPVRLVSHADADHGVVVESGRTVAIVTIT